MNRILPVLLVCISGTLAVPAMAAPPTSPKNLDAAPAILKMGPQDPQRVREVQAALNERLLQLYKDEKLIDLRLKEVHPESEQIEIDKTKEDQYEEDKYKGDLPKPRLQWVFDDSRTFV